MPLRRWLVAFAVLLSGILCLFLAIGVGRVSPSVVVSKTSDDAVKARSSALTGSTPTAVEPPGSSPGNAASDSKSQRKQASGGQLAGSVTKQKWIHGETVWSSPTESMADNSLKRVRLVKTDFHYPLLRIEEKLTPGTDGGEPEIQSQIAMVAGHLMVKAAAGMNRAQLEQAVRPLGFKVASQIPGSEVYLLSIPSPDGLALPKAVETLQKLQGIVSYAEPDFIVHATTTPNDTRFAEQWSLNNTGQTGGTVDADIDAPEAWATTTGSNTVVVAMLDSGMDYTHAELAGNLWTNSGEIAGNGADDDGDGYKDDVHGWNFVNVNNAPLDDQTHGTHVAGIIGAAGNNSSGVSGVCWQVKLMPLKFLNYSGFGATSDAVSAVYYARVKGAHIINHSWGGSSFSQTLKDAIDVAGSAGILNVCAADNGDGVNEDATPTYPASFASSSVIAVASTTSTDQLSSFSNYGPTSIHLAAPGSEILSTLPGNAFGLKSGTSMAVPHVSGIAALLKAYKPTLTGADLKAILQASVDHVAALESKVLTEGRANAYNALQTANDVGVLPATGITSSGNRGGPFTPTSVAYTLKNYRSSSINWTAALTAAPWATVSPSSGTLAAGGSVVVTVTVNTTLANAAVPGLQQGTLAITNTTTSRSITRPVNLDVRIPYIYSFDLSTDPGWTRQGAWQYGTPTGQGGLSYGHPDPTAGATGTKVLGVNLNGDYSTQQTGAFYLTAGPFDLRGYTNTKLEFQRWLNAPGNWDVVHLLEVSKDGGTTWVTYWNSAYYYGTSDTSWTPQSFTLNNDGDNQAAVMFRWSYEVSTATSQTASSWNIDDVKITGSPGKRLYFGGVATKGENTGTAALTLHIEPPPPSAMTVTLVSSDTTAATLPATVTVPAGTSSMTVNATLIDDTLLDGTQRTVLTPSASGYTSIPWNLDVTDNETATLSLSLPPAATEGQAPGIGVVMVSARTGRDVSIALTSSDPTTAVVPTKVVVLAGQNSATFPITFPNDALFGGNKTTQITATVTNWTGASAILTVGDDEQGSLSLNFTPSAGSCTFAEGVTPGVATVSLAAPRSVNTVVSLGLSSSTRVQMPTSVTIVAGQTSATISPITVTNDAVPNGVQTVQVTASAPGVVSAVQSVTVADNEVSSVAIDYVTSPKVVGGSDSVTVRALDVNGELCAGFSGSGTLTARNAGVSDGAFAPVSLSFVNGLASSLPVTWPTSSTSYSLSASVGGATGVSNVFVVGASAVQLLSLTANDIAYDPGTAKLYASTSSGTLVPIDPDTGAMGVPITVSSGSVGRLAVSGADSILYAVVSNGTQLVRVDLAGRTVGAPFTPGFSGQSVMDLQILPGTTNSVLVALSGTVDTPFFPRFRLMVNGTPKSQWVTGTAAGSGYIKNVAVSDDGTHAYAICGGNVLVMSVTGTGVSLQSTYSSPYGASSVFAGGSTLLVDTGILLEPLSGNLVGRIPSLARQLSLDTANGRVMRLEPLSPYSSAFELRLVETAGFSEVGRIPVPLYPTSDRLVRLNAHNVACFGDTQIAIVRTGLLPSSVSPEPDLAVGQLAGPQQPVAGRPLSFSILLRNNGNASASNVTLTDRWPAGTSIQRAVTSQGTVTFTTDTATFNLGTLAPGNSVTASVTLTGGTAAGINSVRVTSSTPESYTLNNSSDLAVTPSTGSAASGAFMLAAQPVDLASQRNASRLFATLGYQSGFYAGMLAIINPADMAVTRFLPIGADPGPLVLSEDDTTLTVGLNGVAKLVQVNTSTLAVGSAYELGNAADGRRMAAVMMAPVPGDAGRLLVARRTSYGTEGFDPVSAGIALYQGSANLGSASDPGVGDMGVTFGRDATQAFGYTKDWLGVTTVSRFGVSGTGGVTLQSSSVVHYGSGSNQLGTGLRFASNRILGQNGVLLDPQTLAYSATLNFSQDYPNTAAVFVEPVRHVIYALKSDMSLTSFDDTTLAVIGTSSLGGPTATCVVRWGQYGVGYISANGVGTATVPGVVPTPAATVVMPTTIAENAGVLTGVGSVQLQEVSSVDITVYLQSTNPALLQVPTSVTIPSGQLTAVFDVTVTDNSLLDGARPVSVIPSGPAGYVYQAGATQVTDNELATVSLSLPSTLAEGAGTLTGQATVSLSRPAEVSLIVQMISSDTTEITVPAYVIIPMGATSADIPLTVLDDGYVRGTQNVTLTATIAGWSSATGSVAVTDHESSAISISYTSSTVSESSYYLSGMITLGGKAAAPLVINLTSSVPNRMSVPATLTIPAGGSYVYFVASPVANSIPDGRQTVLTSATAPGFVTGTASTVVVDDDLGGFVWTIPSTVTAGSVFNITAAATTIDGDPVQLPSGTALSLAASRGGVGVPVIASALANSYSDYSLLNGTAAITSAGTNTVLTFVYGGVTYTSPPLTIQSGPHATFTWAPINGSGLQPNVAYPVTVTAADSFGNPVTNFNGTATLLAAQSTSAKVIGSGIDPSVPLISTSANLSRHQTVFLASEIGQAGSIRTLALQLSQPPGRAFDTFTIRAKHTSRTTPDSSVGWDNTGWTTLKQGALDLGLATGWVEIHLDSPFSYDGISNLLLDISFQNATAVSGGICNCTSLSTPLTVSATGNSGGSYGDPLTWTSGYNSPTTSLYYSRPNMRFGFGTPFSVTPTTTGSFAGGTWSGNVTFNAAANDVVLTAKSGSIIGDSNKFDVGSLPPSAPTFNSIPTFTTSLTVSPSWGVIASATDYYVEAATDNTFTAPLANSGWITTTSYAFSGLTEGTHYYFRVKARKSGLEGAWSAFVDTTVDTVGPKIFLSSVDDTTITNFTTALSPVLIQGRVTDTAGVASFYIISGGTYYPWTVNSDGTWSVNLTTPGAGTYSLGFYAVDKVSPAANTRTRNITITRVADTDANGLPDDWQSTYGLALNGANNGRTADFDHDGRSNLLEYALNTPPNSGSGNTYPNVVNEVNASDGKKYLVYRYDRRRGALDLTYKLEFSTDLVNWSASSYQTEPVGTPTLNGDGVTERVTTRILPDISQMGGSKVFVRLSVTSSVP